MILIPRPTTYIVLIHSGTRSKTPYYIHNYNSSPQISRVITNIYAGYYQQLHPEFFSTHLRVSHFAYVAYTSYQLHPVFANHQIKTNNAFTIIAHLSVTRVISYKFFGLTAIPAGHFRRIYGYPTPYYIDNHNSSNL